MSGKILTRSKHAEQLLLATMTVDPAPTEILDRLTAHEDALRELAKDLADELADIWDPTRHLHSRNVRVQGLIDRAKAATGGGG